MGQRQMTQPCWFPIVKRSSYDGTTALLKVSARTHSIYAAEARKLDGRARGARYMHVRIEWKETTYLRRAYAPSMGSLRTVIDNSLCELSLTLIPIKLSCMRLDISGSLLPL